MLIRMISICVHKGMTAIRSISNLLESSVMKIRLRRRMRPLLTLSALCAAAAAVADPVAADSESREQRLERHVEELAQELQAVRAELQALKAQNQAAARAGPPMPPPP